MDFTGVIIAESLENTAVLDDVQVVSTAVEQVTDAHQTPGIAQWTLHTVCIPAADAEKIAEKLCGVLRERWYADFKNDLQHYIIFRGRVFAVDRAQPAQYEPVVRYGLGLGIPDYQLDFSPAIAQWLRESTTRQNS